MVLLIKTNCNIGIQSLLSTRCQAKGDRVMLDVAMAVADDGAVKEEATTMLVIMP
jgi:hypothetical protein